MADFHDLRLTVKAKTPYLSSCTGICTGIDFLRFANGEPNIYHKNSKGETKLNDLVATIVDADGIERKVWWPCKEVDGEIVAFDVIGDHTPDWDKDILEIVGRDDSKDGKWHCRILEQ